MYKIEWRDGRTWGGFEMLSSAENAVYEEFPDAEIGHDGDLTEGGDRTLCWACKADAHNDDGQRAVAVIRREE